MSDRNATGEWIGHKHDKRCYPFQDDSRTLYDDRQLWNFVDCYAQDQWNKKMARLLAKEPKSMKGFTFMPKGEVV